jgi:hypothetical protein
MHPLPELLRVMGVPPPDTRSVLNETPFPIRSGVRRDIGPCGGLRPGTFAVEERDIPSAIHRFTTAWHGHHIHRLITTRARWLGPRVRKPLPLAFV